MKGLKRHEKCTSPRGIVKHTLRRLSLAAVNYVLQIHKVTRNFNIDHSKIKYKKNITQLN